MGEGLPGLVWGEQVGPEAARGVNELGHPWTRVGLPVAANGRLKRSLQEGVEGLRRRSLEHERMLAVVIEHEMTRLQSPRRQDHGSLDEVPEWFLEIGSERTPLLSILELPKREP